MTEYTACSHSDDNSTRVDRLISDFIEKYPWSICGPAHIVIDDGNVLDGHLKFCIDECDRWLKDCEGDPVEVADTKLLLEEILTIPMEER